MSSETTNAQASAPTPQQQFNGLPDADRERLVAALEQTPPELLVRPFAQAAAQRAGADPKAVESLCFFLMEWFSILSDNPQEYLNRIAEFLAGPPDSGLSPAEIETLRSQWRRIMSADATLGVTLKAFDILRRQGNIFQKAASTTEVRPVYLTDPKASPKHAVLLHQLHITYQTEAVAQTVHIAMDKNSVLALIAVLQRALTKEETLIDQKAYDYLGKVRDAN